MWRSAKFAFGFAVIAMTSGAALKAQEISTNPYHMNYNWDKLQAQKIGVASGIRMDPDGKHLWILDRCGANGSADSDLDPMSELDMDGKMVQSFGKGLMSFPHGFFIDHERNVWVTDGAPEGDPRAESGLKRHLGHQVYKFSPTGKLLMTLGTAGVAGADQTHMVSTQAEQAQTQLATRPLNYRYTPRGRISHGGWRLERRSALSPYTLHDFSV